MACAWAAGRIWGARGTRIGRRLFFLYSLLRRLFSPLSERRAPARARPQHLGRAACIGQYYQAQHTRSCGPQTHDAAAPPADRRRPAARRRRAPRRRRGAARQRARGLSLPLSAPVPAGHAGRRGAAARLHGCAAFRRAERPSRAAAAPKVDIVGHSMVGMLAARFTRTYPARVDHLVLAAPIGLEDCRLYVPPVPTEKLMSRSASRPTRRARAGTRGADEARAGRNLRRHRPSRPPRGRGPLRPRAPRLSR
jgi:pimeloyl-ACP methyl ester carboxylesterase